MHKGTGEDTLTDNATNVGGEMRLEPHGGVGEAAPILDPDEARPDYDAKRSGLRWHFRLGGFYVYVSVGSGFIHDFILRRRSTAYGDEGGKAS